MVNYHQLNQSMEVERVQLIDLENAAYLPKGRCIKGMLAGNDNWRSPEVHFKGELNKPTDIFSFAAVVCHSCHVQRFLLLTLLVYLCNPWTCYIWAG